MRILFASEYYPPFAPGGAEWTNAAWAGALARRGHSVVVVTPNYGAAPRESADGVTVVRVPFLWKLHPGQTETRWLVHRNPLVALYLGWRIWRVARTERVEVIHALGKGALVASWLAARALGLPVLATIRDAGLLCPLGFCTIFDRKREVFDCSRAQYLGKCVPYYIEQYEPDAGSATRARRWLSLRLAWFDHYRLRRRALARVDVVVGVSDSSLKIYPNRTPSVPRHVVYAVPPTVQMPAADQVASVRRDLGVGDGPLVLYVGKLSPGKGTTVLLEALDAIRAAVPGVRFAFAGKGELKLPTRADVHALGILDHSTLFPLYGAADVVVVPSVWREPLSRVIIEAMSFGRPVVATNIGGSNEAVERDVTGLLVPAENAEALADAIVRLLRDPARREAMGAAARRVIATKFSEDKAVASLLGAYAAAAGKPA